MGTKSQISVLPKPKRAPHQQYLPARSAAPEPGADAGPWSLSRRARELPPQPAAVSAQPRVSGSPSARLQGLSHRGTRLPGASLPDSGNARLPGLPGALSGPFRFKKPLFLAISMVGLFWVFGALLAGDRARLRRGLDRRLLSADKVVWPRRDRRRNRRGLHGRTAGNGKRGRFPTASGRSSRRSSCFG